MPDEAQDESAGDLAIVLHSHMPYVEGFGTYPFGEEWLFDAVIRSYLPVLEVARELTMTVTPVLADQLEDPDTSRRMRDFCREYRHGSAAADLDEVPSECRSAVAAELERYEHALALIDGWGGDPLRAFRETAESGRISLMASAATHAVLPLLATREGLRFQIENGIRSHRRRFGWEGGFWLPECAYEPGLEHLLAEHDVSWFCVDQSRHLADPLDALSPIRTAARQTAFAIDWNAISWLWSLEGYPSHPEFAQFAGKSWRGSRMWRIGGGAYDPEAGAAAADEQAAVFLDSVGARLRSFRERTNRRGLLVFAIDTELLGHWWSEGPRWLKAVIDGAAAAGVRLRKLPDALDDDSATGVELHESSWGEGKNLRTWDAPAVADLVWAARRLELRLLEGLGIGLDDPSAERAGRELLALQASDWAFLDGRRQAGDYPFTRATDHAEALLMAIDSGVRTDPRMRALAPDLSLAPLRQP